MVPGLIDPNNEITQPMEIKWSSSVQTSEQNTFTVDLVNGPSGYNFQFDEYVYQERGVYTDSYRILDWFLKRKEPVNSLNKLSVGFFFYSADGPEEPSWKSFSPSGSDVGGEGYVFINYYGFDQELVWWLFYSGIVLNLTSFLSLPLATIPMIYLMYYFLTQPETFR